MVDKNYMEWVDLVEELYMSILDNCTSQKPFLIIDSKRDFHHKDYASFLWGYGLRFTPSSFGDTLDKDKFSFAFSAGGTFLLGGRFVIPVRDFDGNIVTLIGWQNDVKKYITLPTPIFSKSLLWFNIDDALDKAPMYEGNTFVVEGIFDALSLSFLGLPAVATMGSKVDIRKGGYLSTLFSRLVVVMDSDSIGLKARKTWSFGVGDVRFIRLSASITNAGVTKKVKDIDNLIGWFPKSTIKSVLMDSLIGKWYKKEKVLRINQ